MEAVNTASMINRRIVEQDQAEPLPLIEPDDTICGIGEPLLHFTQYWVHTTACVKVDRDLRFFEICVYYNGSDHQKDNYHWSSTNEVLLLPSNLVLPGKWFVLPTSRHHIPSITAPNNGIPTRRLELEAVVTLPTQAFRRPKAFKSRCVVLQMPKQQWQLALV
ncbi:hypothetical protein CY34DRAFT_107703 [Suillus luteus UH-Slu-Lm8-n1]|uniref:Unplaced genomic scaffold CY34scaffold_166, whole genome shotgun sequence n=1 Tax=Suillus luteus UH-Slu-Lm8-n1 TaxID=930992 RepID=A0A0C9ZS19_9AGAM|nr:hypothetical protein CY34DRAFT_107703 [Suillus luteus UH-Slu-Lm8-n1]